MRINTNTAEVDPSAPITESKPAPTPSSKLMNMSEIYSSIASATSPQSESATNVWYQKESQLDKNSFASIPFKKRAKPTQPSSSKKSSVIPIRTATSTPTPTPYSLLPSEHRSARGFSTGEAVGIGVGSAVFLTATVLACLHTKKRQRAKDEIPLNTMPLAK